MKKKVLFLVSTLGYGGSEGVFRRIINATEGQIEPTIAIFQQGPYLLTDTDVKADVRLIDAGEIHGSLGAIFTVFRRARQLRKLIHEIQPDWMVASQTIVELTLFLAVIREWSLAKRCVIRPSYDPYEWRSKGYFGLIVIEAFLIAFFSVFGKVVFQGEYMTHHRLIRKKNSVVIYNFVDAEEIRRLAREPVEGWPDVPVVIRVGRNDPEKNPELAREAVQIVESKVDCILMEISNERNPFKYMAKSQVLVSPSSGEGMSNVLIEALCLGLPIIATDCKGSMETLSGAGLIVPKRDCRSMANWIRVLLEQETVRKELSNSALQRSRIFDGKAILQKWLELFNQ